MIECLLSASSSAAEAAWKFGASDETSLATEAFGATSTSDATATALQHVLPEVVQRVLLEVLQRTLVGTRHKGAIEAAKLCLSKLATALLKTLSPLYHCMLQNMVRRLVA